MAEEASFIFNAVKVHSLIGSKNAVRQDHRLKTIELNQYGKKSKSLKMTWVVDEILDESNENWSRLKLLIEERLATKRQLAVICTGSSGSGKSTLVEYLKSLSLILDSIKLYLTPFLLIGAILNSFALPVLKIFCLKTGSVISSEFRFLPSA
jgi:hypothetical protein